MVRERSSSSYEYMAPLPKPQIIESLIERLRAETPGLLAVYRFGSWGTPDERADSDVDIAVLAETPLAPEHCWDIAQRLAVRLGRDVDLVDLRGASTVLAARIVSQGERLFCSEETVCEAWEDYVYAAYARLNEERRAIIRDIEARGSVYGR